MEAEHSSVATGNKFSVAYIVVFEHTNHTVLETIITKRSYGLYSFQLYSNNNIFQILSLILESNICEETSFGLQYMYMYVDVVNIVGIIGNSFFAQYFHLRFLIRTVKLICVNLVLLAAC